MNEATVRPNSDLKTRLISAAVMIVVAAGALWVGGYFFTAFVTIIALGILWEIWGLVRKITANPLYHGVFMGLAIVYVGIGVATLVDMRAYPVYGRWIAALPIIVVAAIDTLAYFFGRTIGGPKIAPSISPSKTWAGLFGGIVGASIVMLIASFSEMQSIGEWLFYNILVGIFAAIVAQGGDFFQSWMKRRAGVKDSGNLIPGHGGLFDRTDGLIALLFVFGIVRFITT